MCVAQGPRRSDASEARTRGLSVSSQALYLWATALPKSDNKTYPLIQFKFGTVYIRFRKEELLMALFLKNNFLSKQRFFIKYPKQKAKLQKIILGVVHYI